MAHKVDLALRKATGEVMKVLITRLSKDEVKEEQKKINAIRVVVMRIAKESDQEIKQVIDLFKSRCFAQLNIK